MKFKQVIATKNPMIFFHNIKSIKDQTMSANDTNNIKWVKNLGHQLIERIEFDIPGVLNDKIEFKVDPKTNKPYTVRESRYYNNDDPYWIKEDSRDYQERLDMWHELTKDSVTPDTTNTTRPSPTVSQSYPLNALTTVVAQEKFARPRKRNLDAADLTSLAEIQIDSQRQKRSATGHVFDTSNKMQK
jgi:hypothetical protein